MYIRKKNLTKLFLLIFPADSRYLLSVFETVASIAKLCKIVHIITSIYKRLYILL